jgi:hypothetical protein
MKKIIFIFASFLIIISLLLILGNKRISTDVIINAPINKVWVELTDFNKYPDWNPFIRKVSGDIKKGNNIQVTFQIQGSNPIVFTPEIKLYEANNIFQWEGRLLIPGIFTGRHTFQLIKIDPNKTKLIQKENFNGILVPFFDLDSTLKGFKLMNKELKNRIENRL